VSNGKLNNLFLYSRFYHYRNNKIEGTPRFSFNC